MDKKYNHKICELNSNVFSDFEKIKNSKNFSKNFTILLPPPNVTGQLHVGHAWNVTIQDALVRFKHFNEFNSIWLCGMDHAGIATQTKFESTFKDDYSQLQELKKDRKNFIEAIDSWKEDNAKSIRSQWKKMGLLLDYNNEKFTLDNESSKMVKKTFIDLYEKKLIYRASKLVNWDVKLETAISNIEVIKKEIDGKFYYIKYPVKNSKEFVVVATTRPETIFVDACLFINPKDKRVKKLTGKIFLNPLTGSELPLLFDDYVDQTFGTGVMKCTPAHDFNDEMLGKKFKLKSLSCFNIDGTLNEHANQFAGLDRIKARKEIIKFLEEKDLLERIETKKIMLDTSERSGEIIEPLLSLQWFINVSSFKKSIQKSISNKNQFEIFPKKFVKMLGNWIANMEDWCISRQLQWGHQIPAWCHEKTNEVFVGDKSPGSDWIQDNDVLDTWFSSGLLPLSWTGYPDVNQSQFPSSILVTGFDIIFFWVARMIMFSLFYTNKSPFKHVYITGLIRDSEGRKMSKSLGNGIDPLDLIEQYGADSLRLFLLTSSTPGNDIKFSREKLESSWNFLNKFWNSIRFVSSQSEEFDDQGKLDLSRLDFIDKWILNKLNGLVIYFHRNFENYKFSLAVLKLVDFIWNDFCSTYIELTKFRLKNEETKDINLSVLWYIIRKLLVLLNPICPFFTEHVYQNTLGMDGSILNESYPQKDKRLFESESKELFYFLNEARKFRFNQKLTYKDVINFSVYFWDQKLFKAFKKKISKVSDYLVSQNINIEHINLVGREDLKNISNLTIAQNFANTINNDIKEDNLESLKKELDTVSSELKRALSMLANKNFTDKAPKELVEKEKSKVEKFEERKKIIESILKKSI